MLSDATLINAFTGSNRNYLIVWSNGETAYLRASRMRDAKIIATEVTRRMKHGLTIVSVTKEDKD